MRIRNVLPLAAVASALALIPGVADAGSRHLVAPGESLSSVAAADDVSVSALAAANGISPRAELIAGTVIEVPARAASSTVARPRVSVRELVVRPGETLSGIAAATGHSVAYLAWVNHLRPDAILRSATVLRIPSTTTDTASTTPAARAPQVSVRDVVVRPGETLSSIAAASGHTVAYLAWVNHLRPAGVLRSGAVLRIPSTATAKTTPAHSSTPSAGATRPYVVRRGDTLSGLAARSGVSIASLAALNRISPRALLISGATLKLPADGIVPTADRTTEPQRYVVASGDTLSGIAARAGVSVGSLAVANGISADGVLEAGVTLTLPAGARPVGAATGSDVPPYPTPERVTASEIESIAAAVGVPASLAAAIGWQESGFNNDLVSSADARGVMQILPRTWNWIERSLDAGTPLAPASALDNVRGGVLLLRSLLLATHGDERLAIAGYIQGLESVRRHGMYAQTRQYVSDVLALQPMFGGG